MSFDPKRYKPEREPWDEEPGAKRWPAGVRPDDLKSDYQQGPAPVPPQRLSLAGRMLEWLGALFG
jgi:hypothetical protein